MSGVNRRVAEAALSGGSGGDHAEGGRAAAGRAACRARPARATSPPVWLSARLWPPSSWPGPARMACGPPAALRRCGRHWPMAATARGEMPWKSMDVPARPPMLPAFGSVRAWMMTAADIVARAARAAAVDIVGTDGAQKWPRCGRYVDRGTREELRDRQLLGRRSQHADAARPLELHRARPISAKRSSARCGRRGRSRCSTWRCTMPPSDAGTRSSSTSIRVPRTWIPSSSRSSACRTSRHTRPGTRRSRVRRRRVLSYLFPADARLLRGAEGRSLDLAALWRAFTIGSDLEVGKGARQADRRLHRQLRQSRWS